MKTNELAFLKANHVKPTCWRLNHSSGLYSLEFTYHEPDNLALVKVGSKLVDPWQTLHTRRSEPKSYKTANAALSDIRTVQGDDSDVVLFFREI